MASEDSNMSKDSAANPTEFSSPAIQSKQPTKDAEDKAAQKNREDLRLLGFRTDATGEALARLAAEANRSLGSSKYRPGPALTFEPFYFFFYGSLQVPNVLARTCGLRHAPSLEKATLEGWRIMMWGQYPALVPQEGSEVKGMYWKCEDPIHVSDLCRYESDAYRMEFCKITTADGDVIENGRIFVAADLEDLEEGVFDLAEWSTGVVSAARKLTAP